MDQSEGGKTVQHAAGGGQVDVAVGGARLGQAERQFVAVADDLVDLALLLRKLAAGRIGAGKVGGIVLIAFGTGVDDHQLARFDDLVMQVVVQGLAVLGQDGRERDAPALGQGYAFHLADDLLFDDARNDAVARDGMHLVTEGAGVVDRGDFNLFLDQSHRDDRLDQREGTAVGRAQQFHQFQRIVVAGRRKVMDRTAGGEGFLYIRFQRAIRLRGGDAHKGSFRRDGRLRAHPDDVPDLHIVRIDGLFAALDVEDCGVLGIIQPEIIKPGTILTPFVAVVLVLCRGFDVADEKDDSFLALGSHLRQKRTTAADINFFCKHIFRVFMFRFRNPVSYKDNKKIIRPSPFRAQPDQITEAAL